MVERVPMDEQMYEQARQARDPRFDGRFFVGVKTTGIFCRPVCPVKLPRVENIVFFSSAAAASEAGFRPCLRCRPESAPGTPAWMGTSTTVNRALRLISQGALDSAGVEALSARLGVSSRHLSRLFSRHLGASPKAVAQSRKLQSGKKLLDETRLSITDIALASGYGSVRRFNDHCKRVYGAAPAALRKKPVAGAGSRLQLKLHYRPPYDYAGVLRFLQLRAIAGVEAVVDGRYVRTLALAGAVGRLSVSDDADNHCLLVHVELAQASQLLGILERVKCLFDLTADPLEIARCFSRDSALAAIASENPGQRLPGCWDPFEIAVRAIVGQQISVKGATTIMGRIAGAYGVASEWGRCFPTPARLAELKPEQLPMPQSRACAIRDMSQAVAAGDIDLAAAVDPQTLMTQLQEIKGIGQWTANYIGMRALNDPDAFVHNDLILLQVAKRKLGITSPRALLQRSYQWRPWRAYAGMHLWRHGA